MTWILIKTSNFDTPRWCYCDYQVTELLGRKITPPDSKTGPLVVELSADVVGIMKELRTVADSLYVFQGRCQGSPVRLTIFWKMVCSEAGLEGVRLHDFRLSFATLASRNGVPMQVIVKLLGHTTVWTTARYLHASR